MRDCQVREREAAARCSSGPMAFIMQARGRNDMMMSPRVREPGRPLRLDCHDGEAAFNQLLSKTLLKQVDVYPELHFTLLHGEIVFPV